MTDEESPPSRTLSDGSSLIERAIDALEKQLVCPFCDATGVLVTWNYVANPARNGYVAKREFNPCPYCARYRAVRIGGSSAPTAP